MNARAEEIEVTQEAKQLWENCCLSDLYYTPVDEPDQAQTPIGILAAFIATVRAENAALHSRIAELETAAFASDAGESAAWEQVGFWKECAEYLERAKADFDAKHLPKYQKALAENAARGEEIVDGLLPVIARHSAEAEAATKAREAFDRYAQHDRDCLSRKGAHYGPESCDCGLNEARAALTVSAGGPITGEKW
jgi:hypothetical protein